MDVKLGHGQIETEDFWFHNGAGEESSLLEYGTMFQRSWLPPSSW
jgi:hypothetical protein